MFEENLKNKKKDLLNIDNIHGKNLMQRFEEMSEKTVFEEKNKNRVSSVENEIKSYSKTYCAFFLLFLYPVFSNL